MIEVPTPLSTPSLPKVRFSKYGMVVSGDEQLSFDDWLAAGKSLRKLREESDMAFMWAWGDWISYGQHVYGEKYTQGMNVTGMAYQTLANHVWTSSKTPKELRGLPGLTQRHYIAVAKIKDYDLKSMLLIQASMNGWTATGALPKAVEKELADRLGITPKLPAQHIPPPPEPPEEEGEKVVATQPWGDPNASWQNDFGGGFDNPPPATKADQINQLEYDNHQLEQQTGEWFIRYGWLQNQVKQATTLLHLLDDLFIGDSSERTCLDEALTALEAAKPDGGSLALILKVIETYKAGNTTAMIETLDELVDQMESGFHGLDQGL